MPDETGLDTSIPATGWQDASRDVDQRAPKRRRQKREEHPGAEPSRQPPRPRPADGVGTKIDVVA